MLYLEKAGAAATAFYEWMTQEKEYPKIDKIYLCALFAIYNLMEKGTKFGLQGRVIQVQPPGVMQVIDRNRNGDERNQVVYFTQVVEKAIESYKGIEEFDRLLPHIATGFQAYAGVYRPMQSARKVCFDFARGLQNSNRTLQEQTPSKSAKKMNKLKKLVGDIEHIRRRISEGESYQVELEQLIQYIDLKQRENR